ncbi:MAG: type II toxin-antitoxin system VapC family toxin [Wenzhouxiangella sp.]|nr:MAG: type II toxin-antitoxin system VapC family toxin [Wenzhouxiangella sp.]
MLVDTDVLIFNQRGNERAAQWLDSHSQFSISAITWMELVQGARNKGELRTLRQALRFWNADIQPVNEDISARAMFWLEEYALGHGLRMADSLIAASAWYLGCSLVTANARHYRFIDGLELVVFQP